MHFALPGSALVHAAVLGMGLLMFAWPEPDDAPAAQSVSVEVISIASVSANQTITIESDATETLVSAGAEALPPTVPETIEAIERETLEPPVEHESAEPPPPEPIKPTEAKPLEPTEIEPVEATSATPVTPEEPVEVTEAEPDRMEVALLSAISPEPLEAEAVAPVIPTAAPAETATPIQPVQQESLQPIEVTDLKVAPVPHTLSRPRPSEPAQRPRQQVAAAPPPRATPKPPVQQQAQPRPSAPAGNGGQNQADTVAAKPSAGQQGNSGSGGDAEVARYPTQVVSKLRRALRYPRGGGGTAGEVHVQFTVSAGGQPSGIRVVQSSGNAAIDQAGIDTVTRAAPFPPIPAGANRNSWAFTVPLAFVRG
ncbi:MAG: TonB [Devosia sp.]|uniref:energy transducer TonB family protein n=1 Tax=Devosia sp. TaxID=1871048 RepID=UPI002638FFB2|nr:TonB family protein [Devosia sp.]MDB5585514.1 TonB [Devosia sp.]